MSNNRIVEFLEEKLSNLIQIYITERKREGDGMLILAEVQDEVKVKYMPYGQLSSELQLEFNKLKDESAKPSIIYFYIATPEGAYIQTIDLEK